MKIHLEIKGSDLVVRITDEIEVGEPAAGLIEKELCSASLSLETIRQAMSENARSRYKSEPMK